MGRLWPGSPQVTPSTRRAPRRVLPGHRRIRGKTTQAACRSACGSGSLGAARHLVHLARPSLCRSGSPRAPAPTYSLSLWWMSRRWAGSPSRPRPQTAYSNAPSTSSTSARSLAFQPTIRRENPSQTLASHSGPPRYRSARYRPPTAGWAPGLEVAVDQVGRRGRPRVLAGGAAPALAQEPTLQAVSGHQPRHPLARGADAVAAQLGVDPGRPVGAARALWMRRMRSVSRAS
jgi:hypothetical protein